jgi:hypothetical protein
MTECGQIDYAMENGKFSRVKELILINKICPSLYAIQMSAINGHHNCTNFALRYCHNNIRNNVDIKTVHYDYKTGAWQKNIPAEYWY